jgi:hypothetical protein
MDDACSLCSNVEVLYHPLSFGDADEDCQCDIQTDEGWVPY